MLQKALSFFSRIVKGNLWFGLGMVLGSIIGTTTTIAITMGYYGVQETVVSYQALICGG